MENAETNSASMKKRPLEEVDQEAGVASAPSRIQDRTNPDSQDGWNLVEGGMKKRKLNHKKNGRKDQSKKSAPDSTKPTLAVAQHRLNSSIKVTDLQSLVLYCLADGVAPQWVSVSNHGQVRKAVVLMVPGLEKAMFTGGIKLEQDWRAPSNSSKSDNEENAGDETSRSKEEPSTTQAPNATSSQNPDDFLPLRLEVDSLPPALRPLAEIFPHTWPVKAPGDDRYSKLHSPLHAMLTSSIPQSQETKNKKGPKPPKAASSWIDERTPITSFIASREELQENDYVLHPALFDKSELSLHVAMRTTSKSLASDGWRDVPLDNLGSCEVPDSEIEGGSVTVGRTVLAVDCEMCIVEGGEYALTRISIINWDSEIVMDEFVKPERPIVDYLTAYSGVSAKSLENVSTTLKDIQEKLLKIFHSQTILVGQSLESDLRAMKITHPFIVDTSIQYPHPRGPPLKSSLKYLAQKYLSREIQKGHGTKGHDSVEDARACLDLVKLKCEKGPKWGLGESSGEPIFKRLLRSAKPNTSAPAGQPREGRTGAMVDRGAPEKTFGSTASHSIGCGTDAEVVTGVKRAVLGDTDGAEIPSGGVDFVFARFRELEALRGWSIDSRWNKGPGQDKFPDASSSSLTASVADLTSRIATIREFLPPCTLFIVYSGSGDPRDLLELQDKHRTFKKEYAFKKWDELSVRWTDVEEQAIKKTARKARRGIGFMCIT